MRERFRSREQTRLFMVPGIGHCRGGAGPDSFDSLTAIETWRERGQAPASIPAGNLLYGLTLPLCRYGQYARYDGDELTTDGANWICVKD